MEHSKGAWLMIGGFAAGTRNFLIGNVADQLASTSCASILFLYFKQPILGDISDREHSV